jgi:hypothetical protein
MEAEQVAGYTFDMVDDRPGASGARVLVSTNRPADAVPATAVFPVSINLEGALRLYVAATPGATFRVLLDGQPFGGTDAPLPRMIGETFALGTLSWYDCGSVVMPRGIHQVEIRAEGAISLDALLLAPAGIVPNGPLPPPFQP